VDDGQAAPQGFGPSHFAGPPAAAQSPVFDRPSVLDDFQEETRIESHARESWGVEEGIFGGAAEGGGVPGRAGRFKPLSPRDGQLHDAYSRSYRSRQPSLKQVRPDDPWNQDDFAPLATDLFGQPVDAQPGDRPPRGSRGQWFGRYEALLVWPYDSQGHSGMLVDRSGRGSVEPFEYPLVYGNRGVLGWESTKGPGGMFQYTDVFAVSQRLAAATTGGITTASARVEIPGIDTPVAITAGPGERLEGTVREHLTSYRPTVFKRVYFPISTITGGFGLDYTLLRQSIEYSRFADLAVPTASETLDGRRRFSGIGPTFDIEYHRPIGHTSLAMLGGAQMGVLFGSDRWEVLRDGNEIFSHHARRTVTNATVRIGVEWSQPVGSHPDSRVFARFTIEGQNWLHIGNLSRPDAALGLLSGNFSLGCSF
jgi:hypothetical protein